MRKALLFIGILFIFFSAKSQNWEPKLINTMEKYFIVPVEFENFGQWISGIEKDSNLVFKEKFLTLENDSLHFQFNASNPKFSSPFENSELTVQIFGRTYDLNKRSANNKVRRSVVTDPSSSKKVTKIQIFAIITFDSTSEGKALASKTQKLLEREFGAFFINKLNYKGILYKPKRDLKVVRAVGFRNKNENSYRFSIWNSTFPDRNQVALNLIYTLNHENIEDKN